MFICILQVCYSWWVFATLSILGRPDWIDQTKLAKFILSCQDAEKGGIADRPEDMADVWHTVFGLAGTHLNNTHTYVKLLCITKIAFLAG